MPGDWQSQGQTWQKKGKAECRLRAVWRVLADDGNFRKFMLIFESLPVKTAVQQGKLNKKFRRGLGDPKPETGSRFLLPSV
jgi:hypothetical protein